MNSLEILKHVAGVMQGTGAVTYAVGGTARDMILGKKPRDIDMTIFGAQTHTVETVLKETFPKTASIAAKGKGIISCGQDGPEVTVVEGKHTAQALLMDAVRRDFTVNALFINPLNGELADPLGGMPDLVNGTIRMASPSSLHDDPLRAWRMASLASKTGWRPDSETTSVAASIDKKEIPACRIWSEMEKISTGAHPGNAIRLLALSRCLPQELLRLAEVPQNPLWHPEGDALEHTILVAEAAVKNGADATMLLAALLHDVGKYPTLAYREDGTPTTKGHAEAGAEMVPALAEFFGAPISCARVAQALVELHMRFIEPPSRKAARKMARRMQDVGGDIEQLFALRLADMCGRGAADSRERNLAALIKWRAISAEHAATAEHVRCPLMGRDILPLFAKHGEGPGPLVGRVLEWATELSDNDASMDSEALLAAIEEHIVEHADIKAAFPSKQ